MVYKLSGAVNLVRYGKGGLKKRVAKVFKEWGIPNPEKTLVKDHAVENDIGANPDESILEAVARHVVAKIHRKRFWVKLTHRRLPAAQKKPVPAIRPSPARTVTEEQTELF
ncbi:MAG: hypothetical protein HZA81_01895 [Candidatus Taylorbacteria bacterium]|nr:hypothetical protein [Candidatus Taylorbacteria bacterium]